MDKAVEMGIADPNRIGVGGHSYGAFMVANLVAHTDIFKAGVARSGAYNRTLTPFGFQNERRTLWEAPEIYARMSPFMFAHRVNEPLLLIHGEADNNPGTFPMQSERLYQAIKGNGGTAREPGLRNIPITDIAELAVLDERTLDNVTPAFVLANGPTVVPIAATPGNCESNSGGTARSRRE